MTAKTALIIAAICLVPACGKSQRQLRNEDYHRRWVEMYGPKTWEQVQREEAQRTADAAAADRATSEGIRQALTGKQNPWAQQEKDILRQQQH